MKVIFDLDGTLCDITHRRHYVEGDDKDWVGFFNACVDDEPKWQIIDLLNRHVDAKDDVQIWSGRSSIVAQETTDWLARHHINPELLTRMREERDYTPDDQLKFQWLAVEKPKPDLAYDDRNRVVEMWRTAGITCLQVAPGDF